MITDVSSQDGEMIALIADLFSWQSGAAAYIAEAPVPTVHLWYGWVKHLFICSEG